MVVFEVIAVTAAAGFIVANVCITRQNFKAAEKARKAEEKRLSRCNEGESETPYLPYHSVYHCPI